MSLPVPPSQAARPKGSTDLNKALDYDKILKLFTSKHTAALHERQVAVLLRVQRHNPEGFHIGSLPSVVRLVRLSCALVEAGQEQFVSPVCGLIELLGRPLKRQRANEQVLGEGAVEDAFALLAELLHFRVSQVRLTTAYALTEVVKRQGGAAGPVDAVAQRVLNACGVVESCVSALSGEIASLGSRSSGTHTRARAVAESSSDEEEEEEEEEAEGEEEESLFLRALTQLVLQLSAQEAAARTLAREGALEDLVTVLDAVSDFRRPIVRTSVEIIWNVLEFCSSAMAVRGDCASRRELLDKTRSANGVYLLGTVETVGVLKRLIERILQSGFRQTDKELRNEVLIISQLVASRQRNLPLFRQAGMIDLMVEYATAGEFGHPEGAQPLNYNTAQEPDYELKLLLWCTISGLALRDDENLQIVAGSRLMEALLLYIELPPGQLPGPKWTESQLTALRLQALTVLATLVPLAPDAYAALDANVVLLQFMDGLQEPNQLRACVRLLVSVSSFFQDQLGEMGVVESMLQLLGDEAGQPGDIRALAASVVGAVCAGHVANQTRLRRARGIRVLHRFLRFSDADAVGRQDFVISVTDCVWRGVVGNRSSEARLLDMEGVDSLLDLLEAAPQIMRHQVCGVLADLCCNAKTVPYFRAWKSDVSMRSGTRLLLHLWEEEERRLGVSRQDSAGVLQSLEVPLGCPSFAASSSEGGGGGGDAFGRLKRALRAAQSMSVDPEAELRRAVHASDLRPKIYAVLASVGFDHLDDQLSIQELITLRFIRDYPGFRAGIGWAAVKERMRVQPVFADALLLEARLEEAFNVAAAAKCEQTRLRQQQSEREAAEETEFFQSILLQKEQELHQQMLMKRAKIPLASRRARMKDKADEEAAEIKDRDPMGSPPGTR